MNRILMGVVEHLMEPVCDLHYKAPKRSTKILNAAGIALVGFLLTVMVWI